jgi:AcrR family transcriptional regulator
MTTKPATKQKRVGPGRLSAEQMEALPDRLLDAALQQFSENGFSETTMDQIAKAAGASTKTIYARYSNKLDILKAVVKRIVDRAVECHKATGPLNASTTDPRKYLATLGAQISLSIATEAAPLNRMAISEGHRLPELRRLHAQSTMVGAGQIREGLDVWRSKGLLPALKTADVDRAAVLCLSMMTDWTRISTALGQPPTQAEIDSHIGFAVDVFLRGCGYQPENDGRPRRT